MDLGSYDTEAARERIAAIAPPTPLIFSPWLSDHIDREVFLKLECLQVTGSFKLRGAANKILTLDVAQRRREEQILDAMRFAYRRHRLVVEGGGAVGIGALRSGWVVDILAASWWWYPGATSISPS